MSEERKIGRYGDQINQYNEKCNRCGGDTVPVIGQMRICPKCERDGLKDDSQDKSDPYGFSMRDPTPKEKKQLDLDIIELDFGDVK